MKQFDNPTALAQYVLDTLTAENPNPQTELKYSNEYQLLVAVMLSAQCTDVRVNQVTPALFERFPTPEALAHTDFDTLFPYIKQISYPNNKTKHLLATAKKLVTEHKSQVPQDLALLEQLPGVGRKTASVLVSVLFNQPAMPVDTHVFRVANRLGLVTAKTPAQAEKQLMAIIPPERLHDAHHLLILHGRYTCKARAPKCMHCNLNAVCKYLRASTTTK